MERGGRAKNVEENESRSKSGWNFAAVSRLWGLAAHQRKDRPLAKLKIAHDLGGLNAWNSTTRKSAILSLPVGD